MTMNALNGVSSETYIPYIIIQEEKKKKLRKILQKKTFKEIKFSIKIRDIHKTEKNNCISINVFWF